MKTVSVRHKILAVIAYFFWPFSILIVATKLKKDQFLRFHGYQALILGICGSECFLRMIPGLGHSLFNLLAYFWVCLAVFLAFRCWLGECFKVPFVYHVAHWDMD
jgi:uncharacterized membrane protein